MTLARAIDGAVGRATVENLSRPVVRHALLALAVLVRRQVKLLHHHKRSPSTCCYRAGVAMVCAIAVYDAKSLMRHCFFVEASEQERPTGEVS
jgi:hypothetical protein